jgi:hypothetical protein
MDPLRLLDYGALGAAVLVLLLAMGLLMWSLTWMEGVLEMVLDRIEENTQLLLDASHREEDP